MNHITYIFSYTTETGHDGKNEQTQYVLSTFSTFISFSCYRVQPTLKHVIFDRITQICNFVWAYIYTTNPQTYLQKVVPSELY